MKLIGNTLHVIYIKVPGKWRENMREAFERINARGLHPKAGGYMNDECAERMPQTRGVMCVPDNCAWCYLNI